LIGSEKIWDRGPALTSRLQSFESEVLTMSQFPFFVFRTRGRIDERRMPEVIGMKKVQEKLPPE
jgi:hypothetical protein